jgi:hypothetical protein
VDLELFESCDLTCAMDNCDGRVGRKVAGGLRIDFRSTFRLTFRMRHFDCVISFSQIWLICSDFVGYVDFWSLKVMLLFCVCRLCSFCQFLSAI